MCTVLVEIRSSSQKNCKWLLIIICNAFYKTEMKLKVLRLEIFKIYFFVKF